MLEGNNVVSPSLPSSSSFTEDPGAFSDELVGKCALPFYLSF